MSDHISADLRSLAQPIDTLQPLPGNPRRGDVAAVARRVVKSLRELTAGYALDPAKVLGTTFDVKHDEMILVRNVPFSSLCEHHMLPFTGTATLGYIPSDNGGRIVGLSKLARLVDMYARRLQVQEGSQTKSPMPCSNISIHKA